VWVIFLCLVGFVDVIIVFDDELDLFMSVDYVEDVVV